MMWHLNNAKNAAVSDTEPWLKMDDCPLNVKVQLLTRGKVAVYGQISHDTFRSNYLYWAPLPRVIE